MIYTLCGSARFEPLFHEWNKTISMCGHCVFSLVTFPSAEGSKDWYTEQEKAKLDHIHLLKIMNSNAVFVINKDGYIGESTRREVQFAMALGKRIDWLEEKGERPEPFPTVGDQHDRQWIVFGSELPGVVGFLSDYNFEVTGASPNLPAFVKYGGNLTHNVQQLRDRKGLMVTQRKDRSLPDL